MCATIDQRCGDGVKGQEVTDWLLIGDYQMQRTVPMLIDSVDISSASNQKFGSGGTRKPTREGETVGRLWLDGGTLKADDLLANVLGIEVVDRRVCAHTQVEQ